MTRRFDVVGVPPLPDPRVSKVWADGYPLCMFKVRDMHNYQGWIDSKAPEMGEPLDTRIITIVGWPIRNDGVQTLIAQLWDEELEKFGDGVIVPNESILEATRLGDAE